MSDGDIGGYIIGCSVVLLLLVGYAWFQVFRLWVKYIRGKPISSVLQNTKLLEWLIWVVLAILITMFIVWLFYPSFVIGFCPFC
jgi:hypothetical protein